MPCFKEFNAIFLGKSIILKDLNIKAKLGISSPL